MTQAQPCPSWPAPPHPVLLLVEGCPPSTGRGVGREVPGSRVCPGSWLVGCSGCPALALPPGALLQTQVPPGPRHRQGLQDTAVSDPGLKNRQPIGEAEFMDRERPAPSTGDRGLRVPGSRRQGEASSQWPRHPLPHRLREGTGTRRSQPGCPEPCPGVGAVPGARRPTAEPAALPATPLQLVSRSVAWRLHPGSGQPGGMEHGQQHPAAGGS